MQWIYLSIIKLQRYSRWSLDMDKKFHTTLYWACDNLSMLSVKLSRVSKTGSWYTLSPLYSHIFALFYCGSIINALFQYPIRRPILRSREVSKPWGLDWYDRSEIWQTAVLPRCQNPISKRYEDFKLPISWLRWMLHESLLQHVLSDIERWSCSL